MILRSSIASSCISENNFIFFESCRDLSSSYVVGTSQYLHKKIILIGSVTRMVWPTVAQGSQYIVLLCINDFYFLFAYRASTVWSVETSVAELLNDKKN